MKLRTRLILTSALVAFSALAVADVVTYSKLRSFLLVREDQRLEAARRPLEVAFTGDVGGSITQGGLGLVAPGLFVELRGVTGELIGNTMVRFPGNPSYTPRLPTVLDGMKPRGPFGDLRRYLIVGSNESGGPRWRVRVSLMSTGSYLLLASPLDRVDETLSSLLRTEIAVTIVALLAGAALAWWGVRRGLRPLAAVEATARQISAGDLDHRVPGADAKTEVGNVAATLNGMLDRIQGAFGERDATEARLRRFVADASHELRTPIAAVSAYAELFERGANKRPDDLAKVMRGITGESARMKRLVDDLLLLARLDEKPALERRRVDLLETVAEAIDAANTVGPAWPVQVGTPTAGPASGDRGVDRGVDGGVDGGGDGGVDGGGDRRVEVMAEPMRVRQVIDNLLGNVRIHTPPGTATNVVVRCEGNDAVLEVSDHGPGLTPDQAERVFERFYRADPSRSRASGGAGLGLAIVASIVRSYDGSVSVSPTPGGGATFSVRLPLAPHDPPRAATPAPAVPDLALPDLALPDPVKPPSEAPQAPQVYASTEPAHS